MKLRRANEGSLPRKRGHPEHEVKDLGEGDSARMSHRHTIILVDKRDRQIGTADKITPHRTGALHRAFSVFIFNANRELMLQKRAKGKYHSGGLWSNTCCSHPRLGETARQAAHRRLREEMGFSTKLTKMFSFIYRVKFSNGLIEHEFDHVFVGRYDGAPQVNPAEAEAWKWVGLGALRRDLRLNPRRYSFWLKKALPRVARHISVVTGRDNAWNSVARPR